MSNPVMCPVCPSKCMLDEGRTGKCGVRIAANQKVVQKYPNTVSAIQIDPVEKKPLYHFMPGEQILSVGTFGCTMNCGFCQNSHLLSPVKEGEGESATPDQIVRLCQHKGVRALAFTYNEPFTNYELVTETFQIAKGKGIATVLVTNGNVTLDILQQVAPLVDAMNIDLKAFCNKFYQKHGGDLKTVMQTIQYAVKKDVHVEISFLVIPNENDDLEQFEEMLNWMDSLENEIVLHINRYYPARNYKIPPTSEKTLLLLKEKALQHMDYVYIGNLPQKSNDTVCTCGAMLVKRSRGNVTCMLTGRKCPVCGKKLPFLT